jgi:hypothetical protein
VIVGTDVFCGPLGAATIVGVSDDTAGVEPPEFVAVTCDFSVAPRSAAVSV